MPFAYYNRLPQRAQAVYRKSDAVVEIPLRAGRELWPTVGELRRALAADDRARVEAACTGAANPGVDAHRSTQRVVAFRTFLRTLLHELVHHLDYTHLKLADSFHTEGFFKRESSLFKQIVPPDGE